MKDIEAQKFRKRSNAEQGTIEEREYRIFQEN